MKNYMDPVQFDFSKQWQELVRNYGHKPGVSRAFNCILEHHQEILSEYKYENIQNAQAQVNREMKSARKSCRNLKWLRKNFEGIDLADLAYELARELHPKKSFEILQRGEDAVITDSRRTIVFDLKNCDRLSAKGSLVLAADESFFHDDQALEEAITFMDQRLKEERKRIISMQRLLGDLKI